MDSGHPSIPESLQEPFRSALQAAVGAWVGRPGLVSIVLFGSVARRQAHPTSDIDVLLVAESQPRSPADRRQPFLDAWEAARAANGLGSVEWNLVVKTPDEATYRSPLYLDMTEDAIMLLDRGDFFAQVLDGMRARMRELGSRRVHLPDGTWYWDLKPDFRWGEVVEI
jgi:predicted nucleotidyltransferase